MGDWQLSEEAREIIRWLESPEGRCWSRGVHQQGNHAYKWFSFKPDLESEDFADVLDIIMVDLGRYSGTGQRFYKKPRDGCISYYKRYQSKLLVIIHIRDLQRNRQVR